MFHNVMENTYCMSVVIKVATSVQRRETQLTPLKQHVCLMYFDVAACLRELSNTGMVLLDYGAQADIQGSWGQTPLMLSILIEYFEIAELLLKSNKMVLDQQDSSGNTPLHYAIGNDSVEGVRLLLQYDPDVNIMNIFGLTPLLKLCSTKESENMLEIAQLLVNAGAHIDQKDFKSRRTALQRAALSTNMATIKLLLDAGADPNTVDISGRTPVSTLIWEHCRTHRTKREVNPDMMTVLHLLIMAGTTLDSNTYENSSPLILALNSKCTSLVNYLLVHGATQNGNFFGGITPLLHAIYKKDIDSVKILLNWSCDMYRKARVFKFIDYEMQHDAYELAIHMDCPDIALLLVQVGYNVSQIKYLSDYSYDIPGCLEDRPDILQQLRQYVQEPRSLFDATVLCIRQALRDDFSQRAHDLPLPKLIIEDIKLKCVLC